VFSNLDELNTTEAMISKRKIIGIDFLTMIKFCKANIGKKIHLCLFIIFIRLINKVNVFLLVIKKIKTAQNPLGRKQIN